MRLVFLKKQAIEVKLMRCLLAGLLLMMCNIKSFGQHLSEQVINKYHVSVIARVAEINTYTKLSTEQQITLADFFVDKDQTIAAALKNNASQLSILLQSFDVKFRNLLTRHEISMLDSVLYEGYIEYESKQTADYYSRRYAASPEMRKKLYEINLEKNRGLVRYYLLDKDAIDASGFSSAIINRYDSLHVNYTVAMEGQQYLEDRLKQVEKLKPLTPAQKQIIRDNFMDWSFKKGADYYNNFHTALKFATNDRAHFKFYYTDSINNQVDKKSKDELAGFSYRYGFSNELLGKVKPVVVDKYQKESDIDIRLPYNKKSDSLRQENSDTHWAQVKKMAIRAGYYRFSDSRFVKSMSFARQLKLSDHQLDSLSEKDYQLTLMANRYSMFDRWNKYNGTEFETVELEKMLTPGQYDTLLKLESRPMAITFTVEDWKKLKENNLLDGLDSANVYNNIFYYHLNNLVISRRYLLNPALSARLLNSAKKNKPTILQKLDGVLRLKEFSKDENGIKETEITN